MLREESHSRMYSAGLKLRLVISLDQGEYGAFPVQSVISKQYDCERITENHALIGARYRST